MYALDNSRRKKQVSPELIKDMTATRDQWHILERKVIWSNCELREGKGHCQKHTPEFFTGNHPYVQGDYG